MIFWLTPGGDTERGLDQEGHKHLCPIKHVDPSAAAAPEGAAEKKATFTGPKKHYGNTQRRKCFSKDFGVH